MTNEYIRGLIEGEGCFTFCPGEFQKNGRKSKIPTFALAMHERDEFLIRKVRDFLGIRNRIYNYKSPMYDGHKRGRKAILMVRDFRQFRDIIIPLCCKKFNGFKGIQFENWMERIWIDPDVPEQFKLLYRLYKRGFYDREERYRKYDL